MIIVVRILVLAHSMILVVIKNQVVDAFHSLEKSGKNCFETTRRAKQ